MVDVTQKKNVNGQKVIEVSNETSLKGFLHAFIVKDADEAYMNFNEPPTKGFSRLKKLHVLVKEMFLSTKEPVLVVSLCGNGYRLRVRRKHLYAE